jgi:hypothetical protein
MGLNWGYYCGRCGHFYYGTRECPVHALPFKKMVRQTLLEILYELRKR